MGLKRTETVTWMIACDKCERSTSPKATEQEAGEHAKDRGFIFAPGGDENHGFRWLCDLCKPKPRVDWSAQTTLHGTPIGEHLEIQPSGMQKDYIVLTAEERAKGFVRPLRRAYRHDKCGGVTTMGLALCETYAREPKFYSGTFCATCKAHFPVGPDGEFTWVEDGARVGT